MPPAFNQTDVIPAAGILSLLRGVFTSLTVQQGGVRKFVKVINYIIKLYSIMNPDGLAGLLQFEGVRKASVL
jgi:hypothetical protein